MDRTEGPRRREKNYREGAVQAAEVQDRLSDVYLRQREVGETLKLRRADAVDDAKTPPVNLPRRSAAGILADIPADTD